MKLSLGVFGLAVATTLALCVSPVSSGDDSGSKSDGEAADYVFPQMAVCEYYIGAWEAIENHYNDKGEVIATVQAAEEVPWMFDRRGIQRYYRSGTSQYRYRSQGMLTWNDVAKKYEGVWCDNAANNGLRTVLGDWDEKSFTMTFMLTSWTDQGKKVTHKIVEQFLEETRRETTTYRLDGEKEVKVLSVSYKRVSVCPKAPKMLFGG